MADSCIFCRIASGEIPTRRVYEDDLVVAFEDLSPQAPTHVLIIPRKHLASLLDATPEDEALLGRLQGVAARLARERGHDVGGFRLVTNTLAEAGQSVFHLHVHLLAGRRFAWPPG
jgi:histidine triad (HIT) family protein